MNSDLKVKATMRRKNSIRDITPEMHAAAEYFKTVTPWHPVIYGD